MSATENTIKQARGLVEALILLEENFSHLSKINLELQKNLKEADANLNALQGENTGLREVIKDMARDGETLIRKNARLEMTLSQLVSNLERARDDVTQPTNDVLKKEPEPEVNAVPKQGFEPENKGPFYGVHTEKGETIIYPPRECQTTHQLRHFYSLAGLVISPDRLMERGGVHLRGLSASAKHRLRKYYRLVYPDIIEPEKPFVKDTTNHYINSGQSATHGMPEEPGQIR